MTATVDPLTTPRVEHEHREPPRRTLRSRVSGGHLLVLGAGLVAALANFTVLQASSDTTTVLAASSDIPSGAAIEPTAVEAVEVGLDGTVVEHLVPGDAVTAGRLDDSVAAVAIPAGALLRDADLRDAAAATQGWRRMSVPIARERAVDGALSPEDRVDLIAVLDGEPAYLVTGARVLAVSDGPTTSLAVGGELTITIAVEADTALCLVEALEQGELTAVLATGQEPAAATGCGAAAAPGDPVSDAAIGGPASDAASGTPASDPAAVGAPTSDASAGAPSSDGAAGAPSSDEASFEPATGDPS